MEELGKPGYLVCDHRAEAGCQIYTARPKACRDYTCLWLDGEFSDGDQPEAIGLVFDLPIEVQEHADYLGVMVICAWELRPGARNEPRAATLLMQLSSKMVVRLTADGGGTQLMGPKLLIDRVLARLAGRLNP